MTEPIPAATLVLMRDAPDGGAPLLLMIRRGAAMRFAANALVFPGGRIDPGDHALAATFAPADPDETAARIAAIRETIEEVGVAVGLVPPPDAPALARLRGGLAAGEAFGALLDEARTGLAPDALTPFARWRPNLPETRVFDTRFYLAAAPEDAIAEADGAESHDAIWIAASAVLEGADAGRHHIIFPTRRNLERLAALASHAAARAHAAAHPVATIIPWIEERGGESWLCIPEGQGYPVTAERLASARRG